MELRAGDQDLDFVVIYIQEAAWPWSEEGQTQADLGWSPGTSIYNLANSAQVIQCPQV